MATYTVKPGDTLPGIAKLLLGDPGRWRELQIYNQSMLVDPSNFAAGMVLRLPPGAAIPAPTPKSTSDSTAGAGADAGRTRRFQIVARAGRRPPFNR